MKRQRRDFSHDGMPLADNPFQDLAHSYNIQPAEEDPSAPQPVGKPTSEKPYSVAKTRNGAWPLAVERRPGGKTVTIVSNVEGDTARLLQDLKRHCATGGTSHDCGIELQGDQRRRISEFLDKHEK